MVGAIAGDIIGSFFEHDPTKTKDFPLLQPGCTFTDDTVLTVAVARAILENGDYGDAIREIGQQYPHPGYGLHFYHWLMSGETEPYSSMTLTGPWTISGRPMALTSPAREACPGQ